MAPMMHPFRPPFQFRIAIAVVIVGVLLLSGVYASIASRAGEARGLAAFDKVAAVFEHPRCINCHHSGQPRVRDNSRKHIPSVRSGNDGTGVGGGRCQICHRDTNNELTRIPGRKGWRMPPYTMSWDGLGAADICDNIKDRSMNGDRNLKALKHHFVHDEFIKWAWNPGSKRSVPPVPYDQFIKNISVWLDAGAPCPVPADK
ncbi:MAG: hypothetical protein ACR2PA_11865 [Hyphomicrobiaceae bacterium]